MANPSYQITAGDVYTLTYNNIVEVITVDFSYRLTIPGLGVINVADQTYQILHSYRRNSSIKPPLSFTDIETESGGNE
ncbi:hypothetical protein FACS189444_6760 [Spirochaetia bacterium]|nr:hypothetical protein FACS189444_6760 [Spirochaetia bacterium]